MRTSVLVGLVIGFCGSCASALVQESAATSTDWDTYDLQGAAVKQVLTVDPHAPLFVRIHDSYAHYGGSLSDAEGGMPRRKIDLNLVNFGTSALFLVTGRLILL
jgi:hypothetical protein